MRQASGSRQAPGVLPPQSVADRKTAGYLRRRQWRMMNGMLITLGGVAPTAMAVVGTLTTPHWVWWVGLAVVLVLMTCATAFASLNHDHVQRSALELATWLLVVTFGAGAVGVALGVVAVVSLRTWWVVAVPLSSATGASLVAWLGMATVHSLSYAPSPGVDLLTRAQKEDVGRLLALSTPGWLRRTRLTLLAVALGWVLPLPGLVVVYPWSLTARSVAVAGGVVVCLLLGGFAALAASRIDPSSAWAIAQTKLLVGLALVATAGALVVGGPVAMSLGGQLAASLVLSCASLACVATVVLVRQVWATSWAVWRARTGLLGAEVARWVAESDEAGALVLAPVAGAAPGRVPRGPWRDQLHRLLWPVRSRALSAEAVGSARR